jgi:hypothetical protein
VKNTIYAIILLSLFGCQNDERNSTTNEITLNLIGEKRFEFDSETPSYNPQYQIIEEDSLRILIFFNKKNNSLYQYNYENQELIRKIKFNKEGSDGTGENIRGFLYHNKDSIFLHSYTNRSLLLFNNDAELKNKLSLTSEVQGTELPTTGHLTPIILMGNTIFLNNGGKCNGGKDFPLPPVAIQVNLSDSTLEYKMEYPKEFYFKENGWPGSLCDVYNAYNSFKEEFIYSFAMSSSAVFTNHDDFFRNANFSSSIVDQGAFRPTYPKSNHPIEMLKSSSQFAQYGAVYFDHFRRVYLRFANTRVPDSRLEKNNFKPKHNSS